MPGRDLCTSTPLDMERCGRVLSVAACDVSNRYGGVSGYWIQLVGRQSSLASVRTVLGIEDVRVRITKCPPIDADGHSTSRCTSTPALHMPCVLLPACALAQGDLHTFSAAMIGQERPHLFAHIDNLARLSSQQAQERPGACHIILLLEYQILSWEVVCLILDFLLVVLFPALLLINITFRQPANQVLHASQYP